MTDTVTLRQLEVDNFNCGNMYGGLTEEQVARYLSWLNDKEVTRYLEARFDKWSSNMLQRYIMDSKSVLRAIFYEERFIGMVKTTEYLHHKRAEVSIMVGDKTYWNRGIGTASVLEIVRIYAEQNFHKLTAGMYHTHIASRRIFKKAGFEDEAVVKEEYWWEGQWVDRIVMRRFL